MKSAGGHASQAPYVIEPIVATTAHSRKHPKTLFHLVKLPRRDTNRSILPAIDLDSSALAKIS
jgi:hypothetical protein